MKKYPRKIKKSRSEFKVNPFTTGLNNLVTLAKNGNTDTDFNKMLEDARKANAEILDMGEGIFRISTPMPNSSDMMSIMVDKNLARVISSATLNGLGKPKYIATYMYEKTSAPILKTVVQRSFSTSGHGIEMKSERDCNRVKILEHSLTKLYILCLIRCKCTILKKMTEK